MIRSQALRFAYAALTLALASCGGGGSDSPTPSPTPASRESPLAFTASNAGQAAALAMSEAQEVLALGQTAVDWLEAVAGSRSSASSVACVSGGNVALTWTDSNGDGVVGPGDRVTASLDSCYIKPLGSAFSGSATIDLVSPESATGRWSGSIALGSGWAVSQSDVQERLGGALRFDQTADHLSKLLRVRSATAPVTSSAVIDGASVAHVISNVDTSREVRRDTARASVSVQLRIASDVLGGAIVARSATAWGSWFESYPDVGNMQLSGASGPMVVIAPGASSTQVLDVTLGGTVVGTLETRGPASGFLWSGVGWHDSHPEQNFYELSTADLVGFKQLDAPASNSELAPGHGALVWAFTRPLDAAQFTSARFERTDLGSGSGWGAATVPATMTVEGALLTITPTTPLEPGVSYNLALSPATAHDTNGHALPIDVIPVKASRTVTAAVSAGAPGYLLGTSSTMMLDASASSAAGSAVVATRWRVVSGPTLVFSGPAAARTTIQATNAENGVSVVELEVENGAGDIDRKQLSIRVVADTTNVLLMNVRVDGGTTAFLTSTDGTGSSATLRDSGGVLDVFLQNPVIGLHRLLASPVSRVGHFVPGVDTTAIWSAADSPVCSTYGGTLDVLELEVDGTGQITRLAADLALGCDGHAAVASLRYNSTLALTP